MQTFLKISFITFLFFLLTDIAVADWNNRLVYFYCIPELHRFQIQAINMEDGFEDYGAYKAILNKNNLFAEDFEQKCSIKNDVYTILVKYDEARAQGMCGDAEEGHITIKRNNNIILQDVPFNADCGSRFNITNIDFSGLFYPELILSGSVIGNDTSEVYRAFKIEYNLSQINKIDYEAIDNRITTHK